MNPNDLFLRAHANKADPSAAITTASGDPTPEQLSLLFKLDQQHNRQQRAQRDHDQQDAQIAQLLDQMDDYKPIVSTLSSHSAVTALLTSNPRRSQTR